MATTYTKFAEQLTALRTLCNDIKGVMSRTAQIVDQHNKNGYSTANDEPNPSYVQENANGNLDTFLFGTADYINAINLLNQLTNFFSNQSVTQGDYRATLEKIATAVPEE